MADCTLFLVKIFRKPSKVQKGYRGSSYITLKVLSNKTKLFLLPYSFNKGGLKRRKITPKDGQAFDGDDRSFMNRWSLKLLL
jgi:hypothetical protein